MRVYPSWTAAIAAQPAGTRIVLVSANVGDFDLLLRMRPEARVLLYRPGNAGAATG